ncbi:NAD(P)H-hydrate dehydratase [Alteromonas sp. a30]|uniref:NAD(P)H-hydrate dehydratase n=1 Tax=Alteromonas sp. a30 TaxID=2730917 RepID=UPI002281C451|nr:NAD(P)H-hydrate dehydratase [Alteromonas sp. a30]MCY7294734.1 NAD(P)H-hydrate dehydratase [Alteromonas sp. a30]
MNSYVNIFPQESLTHKIYKAEQVRKVEPVAAKQMGVAMYTLMERAGLAVFNCLRQRYAYAKKIVVLAGKGNNGGDAYVAARLAHHQGVQVTLCEFADVERLSNDAKKARQAWASLGISTTHWQDINFSDFDVCIDGLLGTGIQGEVTAPFSDVIEKVNNSSVPVMSIDIPSGLNADTGSVCGSAICAEQTITFVGIKAGLVTGIGKQHTGVLHFDDLGIGDVFQRLADSKGRVFSFNDLHPLPKRELYSHKGNFGKLLCIGGNEGMSGAIRMSAEAAMRCGAGLVKVFCHPTNVAMVASGRPELMVMSDDEALKSALHWCDSIIIGPGLGTNVWASRILKLALDHALETHKALVVDADALNLCAQDRKLVLPKHLAIITPHPAEAGRMLHTRVEEVERNRYQAVNELANRFDCVALLKGAGTIVASQGNLWVCENGNPGMATAGMGDVLSGVLGGLLAQGMGLRLSAIYGMCLHSYAADLAVTGQGERGLLATDLLPFLRQLVNSAEIAV